MKSLYLQSVLDQNALIHSHVVVRQKNFEYYFIQKGGIYGVVLIDEDDGKISLTNAMENVVAAVIGELLLLEKITNKQVSSLRFFAYGTDEIFSEPKIKVERCNLIKNGNKKYDIECSVNSWEYVEDSDPSWKMVFLLG